MCKNVWLYILVGLLLVLPFAMQGQTIKRFESDGWWMALTQGSPLRTLDVADRRVGQSYMIFDDGIGSVVSFDFVNGLAYGPDMTFGYVDRHYGRWELAPEIRYSERRHNWRGEVVGRYFLPPAYYTWVEAFYRRKCVDFDGDAFTAYSLNNMASALTGWNGYKLYEAEQWGAKTSMAIACDFQLEVGAWHESRWQVDNHRQKSLFHKEGESNVPRLRGVALEDAIHQWRKQQLWRVDVALEFTFNRMLMCYNDLRTAPLDGSPVVRLAAQSGWGDADYLSLDLSVKQRWGDERNRFQYLASAGFFPKGKEEVPVMDMHHFDATHMAYQRSNTLTWFSLLSNYELSTSRQWGELHGEWQSCKMAVTQLTNDPALCEYLQLHTVNVAGHSQHTELSYGFDLADTFRIGCSFGWDGVTFDGVGLNFVMKETIFGERSKARPVSEFF